MKIHDNINNIDSEYKMVKYNGYNYCYYNEKNKLTIHDKWMIRLPLINTYIIP